MYVCPISRSLSLSLFSQYIKRHLHCRLLTPPFRSSLAAVQADSYYRPPDKHDEKLNKKTAKRAKRALKREPTGVPRKGKVVRFALAHDGRCMQCDASIGEGKRFNGREEAIRRLLGNARIRVLHEMSPLQPLVGDPHADEGE